jgi:hypothetical protein
MRNGGEKQENAPDTAARKLTAVQYCTQDAELAVRLRRVLIRGAFCSAEAVRRAVLIAHCWAGEPVVMQAQPICSGVPVSTRGSVAGAVP